jgi:hypothetical protein
VGNGVVDEEEAEMWTESVLDALGRQPGESVADIVRWIREGRERDAEDGSGFQVWSCVVCGSTFTADHRGYSSVALVTPFGLEYGSGCCSSECIGARRARVMAQAAAKRSDDERRAVASGRRRCKAPPRGVPNAGICLARPLYGTDLCSVHASDDLMYAVRFGAALGGMAVDQDRARSLLDERVVPGHVADALRNYERALLVGRQEEETRFL